MIHAFEKIFASIVIGMILPLLLFRFQVNPWVEAFRYWNVVIVAFAIAFLVYKYRDSGEGRITLKTHLINFVISFLVLCVVAVVYFLVLATLTALI